MTTKLRPMDYIEAARVPGTLRPQSFGAWTIARVRRLTLEELRWAYFSSVTMLCWMSEATLHMERGETVMEDSITELRRHLPIWLNARGRVLVTGLGLGCVVRGLLRNPLVDHIDVMEIDRHVLRVVGAEFEGNPRVTLHIGDALDFNWPDDVRWDYAWHDICGWDHHTQVLHVKLMKCYFDRCGQQGAWMLPRRLKQYARKHMPTRLLL